MSTVIEYHQCEMKAMEGDKPPPSAMYALYRCTHINVDGVPCGQVITAQLMPYFGAGSHVTSSKAITARFTTEASNGSQG